MTTLEEETAAMDAERSKSVAQLRKEGDTPTRSAAVVALRMAGAPFDVIADELGYSNATAVRNAYERALAAAVGDYRDIAHQRTLAIKRLEALLLSVWDASSDPNNLNQYAAQRSALSLIDRIIRLQGLDAPQQVVVHSPSSEDTEAWLRAALASVRPEGMAEEEEIIDAEVVPGDD